MRRFLLALILLTAPASAQVPDGEEYVRLRDFSNLLYVVNEHCEATRNGPSNWAVAPPQIVEQYSIATGVYVSSVITSYWVAAGSTSPVLTSVVQSVECLCDYWPDWCESGGEDFCWTGYISYVWNAFEVQTNYRVGHRNLAVTNWAVSEADQAHLDAEGFSPYPTRAFVDALDATIFSLIPQYVNHMLASGGTLNDWFRNTGRPDYHWDGESNRWMWSEYVYDQAVPMMTVSGIFAMAGAGTSYYAEILSASMATADVPGWTVGDLSSYTVPVTYFPTQAVMSWTKFTRQPERAWTEVILADAYAIPSLMPAVTSVCGGVTSVVEELESSWVTMLREEMIDAAPGSLARFDIKPVLTFGLGQTTVMSRAGGCMTTNQVQALEPVRIYISGWVFDTNIFGSVLTGELIEVEAGAPADRVVCSNPYYRISAFSVSNLTPLGSRRIGDLVRISVSNEMVLYGDQPWYIYPEDLNERYRVLALCQWTAPAVGWTNCAFRDGSVTYWVGDTNVTCGSLASASSEKWADGWFETPYPLEPYYAAFIASEYQAHQSWQYNSRRYRASFAVGYLSPQLEAAVDWYGAAVGSMHCDGCYWPPMGNGYNCGAATPELGAQEYHTRVSGTDKPLGVIEAESALIGDGGRPSPCCHRDGAEDEPTASGWDYLAALSVARWTFTYVSPED